MPWGSLTKRSPAWGNARSKEPRPNAPTRWEDGRRVVSHTAIVRFDCRSPTGDRADGHLLRPDANRTARPQAMDHRVELANAIFA